MCSSHKGLYGHAWQCIAEVVVDTKIALTFETGDAWKNLALDLRDAESCAVREIEIPGRPVRPELVHPKHLAARGLGSAQGRAATVHAIAHIEFNAINLAWDAVYRFRGLPKEYYDDWVAIACDEARHFMMLQARLRALGYEYGDFPAHNGLWEMACKTASDSMLRMALVPRVLEARGLDVTPGLIARFKAAGDEETAAILEIILREEVPHVAAGSRWFRHLCSRRGLAPEATFLELIKLHAPNAGRGEMNREARLAAGFNRGELDAMCNISG